MRRKKTVGHANHERWLVSYADFITLMFAFFVVMFASSQTDKGKAEEISAAVKRAIEQGQLGSTISGILGGTPGEKGRGNAQMKGPGGQQHLSSQQQGKAADLQSATRNLQQILKTEIGTGNMQVALEERGMVISLQQSAFFPSGTDEIPVATYPSIEKIAEIIKTLPNRIRCEGHTDSTPLRASAAFQSNWELSSARAIAMMELLVQCCDIPRERFSVSGYADNAPTADNASDEGRRRNRRVDIVVLSETGLKAEPKAATQTAPPPKVDPDPPPAPEPVAAPPPTRSGIRERPRRPRQP